MDKYKSDYLTAAAGTVLLLIGLYLTKTFMDPQGFMLALPYVCIGLGCGIFGHGMGNIVSGKAVKNAPDIQRQIDIEQHDERNIAIISRAKAKGYDMMTFVFSALMLSFALMGVDLTAVLLLVFSYLFVHGYRIYYQCKYDKEM